MSEPVTEAPEQDPQQPPEGDHAAEELSPEALRKQLEKARKEAANYRTRVRELEPAAKRLTEIEEASKTETQKLAERAEAAEKAAADAQREMARLRVLAEVNLPADLHEFVVGNDEDELRAKAKKLAAQFGADNRSVDVGLGPRGTAAPASMTNLIRKAAGRG